MDYDKILEQVDVQKKEKSISGKMFRYSGLIMAVDYFSQQLNSEQIMLAAFDFINELLTLESSSLFCKKDDKYVLVREKGRNIGVSVIKSSQRLNDLPVFHGSILSGRNAILKYFDEDIYQNCSIELAVPIIVDTTLEGFLLIPERSAESFDDDDLIICQVLMNLCNSAMRNYRSYSELQIKNKSLDEKIFNLFAINQSSKALLSQLDLDSLYSLSIDVFSELTQSSATGFVLYDEKSEKYVLRSYRFIFENDAKHDIVLEMNEGAEVDPNRIIIDVSDDSDAEYFNSLFTAGIISLSCLKARYIILLNKGRNLLGFVTLGATVTGTEYKRNIFELVESLASSTYIAISNAKNFKKVEEQKALIQSKLDRLISLNTLVRNINSSADLQTLLEITVQTLTVSFLAEKCLLALYDDGKKLFNVRCSCGINDNCTSIKTNKYWNSVMKGKTVLILEKNELKKFFGQNITEAFGAITGALIVPIYLDRSDINMLGVIIVFSFSGSLISDQENVLTLETISGHIAPVLHNLNIIEEQETMLMPNYAEIFRKDLDKEIKQAENLDLDLLVVRAAYNGRLKFNIPDIAGGMKKMFKKIYPVSCNMVYAISNNRNDGDIDKIMNTVGEKDLSVDVFVLGHDFNSTQELLSM